MRSRPGPPKPAESKSWLKSIEFYWEYLDGFHSGVQHRVEEKGNWGKEIKLNNVKANGRHAWTKPASISISKKGPRFL